jgi:hypothetical protein
MVFLTTKAYHTRFNTKFRMEYHILATSIAPSRHHLPYSKHVLIDSLPKPGCHNLQRPEPDQDALGGIMLLFHNEKEAIIIANACAFATFNVSVDYGESNAHGYVSTFVLDEHTRWKYCGELFNHVKKSLLATPISWGCSNYDCLFPLGPCGGNHTKEPAGGKSKCALVHRRAVCCIHSHTIGDIHNK